MRPSLKSLFLSSLSYFLGLLFFVLLTLSVFLDEYNPKEISSAASRAEYVANLPLGTPPEGPPPKAENIILIIVDTLRSDRLGFYGFRDKPISPNLDKLAEESAVFDTFYAASPWTAPSFASILTGVSPAVHHTGLPLPSKERGTRTVGARNLFPINKATPTLAECLKGKMYTAAVMNNIFLNKRLGFHRGFDHYDYRTASVYNYRTAKKVTQIGISWLEKQKKEPFFLLLHYFDPHLAYNPPKQYHNVFLPKFSAGLKLPFHAKNNPKAPVPSQAEQRFIKGAYNGEVRFVDDQIGILLKTLRKQGLLDNSWLIFTADHGEELYDHGGFEHGHRYEDEVTRLPLLIRAPGGKWGAGRRIPYTARHIDLMPTILEMASVEKSLDLEGKSLFPLIAGKSKKHRPAYIEYNLYGKIQLHAFFDGRYKLIRQENGKKPFMYDLEKDPGELNKLGRRHPHFAVIEKQLNAYRADRQKRIDAAQQKGAPKPVSLPPEEEEALRKLGYID